MSKSVIFGLFCDSSDAKSGFLGLLGDSPSAGTLQKAAQSKNEGKMAPIWEPVLDKFSPKMRPFFDGFFDTSSEANSEGFGLQFGSLWIPFSTIWVDSLQK